MDLFNSVFCVISAIESLNNDWDRLHIYFIICYNDPKTKVSSLNWEARKRGHSIHQDFFGKEDNFMFRPCYAYSPEAVNLFNPLAEWFNEQCKQEWRADTYSPFFNPIEEFSSAWHWKVYEHKPHESIPLLQALEEA